MRFLATDSLARISYQCVGVAYRGSQLRNCTSLAVFHISWKTPIHTSCASSVCTVQWAFFWRTHGCKTRILLFWFGAVPLNAFHCHIEGSKEGTHASQAENRHHIFRLLIAFSQLFACFNLPAAANTMSCNDAYCEQMVPGETDRWPQTGGF